MQQLRENKWTGKKSLHIQHAIQFILKDLQKTFDRLMLKILTFLTQTYQSNKKSEMTHQPHKNNSDIYYTSHSQAYMHTSERRVVSSMG